MDNKTDMDKAFAQMIAAICVRNTHLENLHSGVSVTSETGDYSDVKVVTPSGEIAWNEISRFNDEDMKILMKQVVDKVYTFLRHNDDPVFLDNFMNHSMRFIQNWDEPKIDKNLDKMTKEKKHDMSKTSNNST
jgi:hypothetical protein